MTEKFQPKNQDLDNLVRNESIQKAKKGARNAAIGLGVIATGFAFDYGIVDDLICFFGGMTAGYNANEAINYLKYTFSRDKPADYRSE